MWIMAKKHDPSTLYGFLHHFVRNLIAGLAVLSMILLIGILGCRYFEHSSWVDSYANVAMIVSGVGTLGTPGTNAGKIFIGTYSIIGGASFLLVVAVVFAPIFHWLFRRLRVEDRDHF